MNGDEKFELTYEGNIDKHLDVGINKKVDGTYEIGQHLLIQRIIDEMKLESTMTQNRPTPVAKLLLHNDLKGK